MWVEAGIEPAAWERAALTRNGEPLELSLRHLAGTTRVVAEWPRSGPGRYALALALDGAVHELSVELYPEKIGAEYFARLLEELETQLPASVAFALQRAGGLAGVAILPPAESALAEEVARLRRAVVGAPGRRGLAWVLEALSPAPHRILRPVEVWTPAERARRPHPGRLAHALVQAGNLGPDRMPVRLLDARVEPTVDVYENRLVHAFVRAVDRRLRRAARAARGHGAVKTEVSGLAAVLHRARRRASFLNGVGELDGPPDRLTMVLLNRSPYRAALEGYLELHRRLVVRLEDPALEAPLENLPRLYQLWGTLHVIRTMVETASSLGWSLRVERIVERGPDLLVHVLRDGRPALVITRGDGARATLYPELSVGRTGPLRSTTYTQVPDVTVVVEPPGERPRLYLFDPKYKLEGEPLEADGGAKPKKMDIDKMHAYRDAICDASGRQVVEYAAILYPGSGKVFPEAGVEAISAKPAESATLHERLSAVFRDALSLPKSGR